MGVDHNAYIGPYLRVTVTVEKRQVDNCEEHNRGDTAYCPVCGRTKADRVRTYEADGGAPDDWEEDYKKKGGSFSDYLNTTSYYDQPDNIKGKRTYIYLPNRYYKELGLPHIEGGKYSEEEVSFDSLDIPKITKKFKELYKDEIKFLEQWFVVEVKFGYVSYCS